MENLIFQAVRDRLSVTGIAIMPPTGERQRLHGRRETSRVQEECNVHVSVRTENGRIETFDVGTEDYSIRALKVLLETRTGRSRTS